MEPKPLTGIPLILAAIAVSLGTFLIVIDYSIANVSIPYIAGDLASSLDEGTYVITSFAIGNAIVLPMCGWLTKRLGAVRLILLSLLGFTLLSLGCGMSPSLPILVVMRFLQGAAAGPMIPLSQSLIVRIFPQEKKNIALAFWSTVTVAAPILGPIVGGWICFNYTWPWIFFINLPVGFFCVLIIHAHLGGFETPREKKPIDWIGFILLAVGTSMFQFMLDKGEQYDWFGSRIINTCLAVSFLCLVFMILWELMQKNPLIELHLLKIRTFALSIILIGVCYAIYFGSVVLVPLWLQEYMNYTSVWAGLVVAPIGIAPLLFTGFVSEALKRINPIYFIGLSLLLFALSSFVTAFFNTDIDFWHIAFSRFLLGCGLLFFIVPLFSLSMQGISEKEQPSAFGFFHYVRAMSGAVGTSVFTTSWVRRSAFHHSNIAAAYNPSANWTDNLALTNKLVDQQAAVLGLNDCFYLMGWVFVSLLFLLLFVRNKGSQYNPPKTVHHVEL